MFMLERFIEEVNKRIDAEKDALARGVAKNFDEYKKVTGTIAGLNLALTMLEDIVRKTPKEERY